MTVGDGLPASPDESRALTQACFDEGLLTRAFGGVPAITKKGRELVKLYAIQDEEVYEALQSTLAVRLRDRGDAFVNLVEFVVLRRDGRA